MLTPREREVAALVAKGLPAKRIASTLGIAENTVRAHIRHAAERLPGDAPPIRRIAVWFVRLDASDVL